MRSAALDGRLLSVAKFVRQGAVFADVGTDHGYLPLFLLSEGRIERAICSDINEGPLESARANAVADGLEGRVKFYLTDGAAALSGEDIDDLAICGMGGELIADIIDRAPFLRNGNIRLILQPMSRQGQLREYLFTHGYKIEEEVYSHSQGRYYLTVCASFKGEMTEPEPLLCELGEEKFLLRGGKDAYGYLLAKRKAYQKIANGKIKGGESAERERAIIERIDGICKGIKLG